MKLRIDKMNILRRIFQAILNRCNVRLVNAGGLARLRGTVDGMVKLKEMHADADQQGMHVRAVFEEDPAASLYVAAAFAHMLADAENYREISFTPSMAAQAKLGPDSRFFTITIQKHGMKTPHQLRQEAELKLAQLQLAVMTAAKPFVGPLEWLGPENVENGVCDTDKVMQGASGCITIGDLRRVVALFNDPTVASDLRPFDKNARNNVIDQAKQAHALLHKLQSELQKPRAYKVRGYLQDMAHVVGAHLNTITRAVLGEEAPVYDPERQ